MKIDIVGNIRIREGNKTVSAFSNIILDPGLLNLCKFLSADEGADKVTYCWLGIGGIGDDLDPTMLRRTNLVNPINQEYGGKAIVYSIEFVQYNQSVVFTFKFNEDNLLYNNASFVNEIGLFLGDYTLVTYKSFQYTPYTIKYNKEIFIDYEIKIRRFSTPSQSSISSLSSRSSTSSASIP